MQIEWPFKNKTKKINVSVKKNNDADDDYIDTFSYSSQISVNYTHIKIQSAGKCTILKLIKDNSCFSSTLT